MHEALTILFIFTTILTTGFLFSVYYEVFRYFQTSKQVSANILHHLINGCWWITRLSLIILILLIAIHAIKLL